MRRGKLLLTGRSMLLNHRSPYGLVGLETLLAPIFDGFWADFEVQVGVKKCSAWWPSQTFFFRIVSGISIKNRFFAGFEGGK